MPRERRRRRRVRTEPATAAELRRETSFPGGAQRRWWKPTLGVFTAFFAGLWLAGTLAFDDDARAVVFFVGVAGLALGLARTLRLRLIRGRRERLATGREWEGAGLEGDED